MGEKWARGWVHNHLPVTTLTAACMTRRGVLSMSWVLRFLTQDSQGGKPTNAKSLAKTFPLLWGWEAGTPQAAPSPHALLYGRETHFMSCCPLPQAFHFISAN